MSRAQSTQIANTGQTNSSTDLATAKAAEQPLAASLTGQLANPGYTNAQKTSTTGATEGGIGAAFGSANEGAANTAARTNNAAGLTSQQDALARQRMITSGNLSAQNEETFANDAQKQTQEAQAGLGNLYGQSLSAGNQALGTAAGASAAAPSFWDQFGSAAAKSLGTFGGSTGGGSSSVGFG